MEGVETRKSYVRTPSNNGSKSGSRIASRLISYQPRAGTRTTVSHLPNEDPRPSMSQFHQRHSLEMRVDYQRETIIDGPLQVFKYTPVDAPDLMSRQPSYRKFKIPYEMICGNRYRDSIKAYEAQLKHEVKNIIDFQRTAADACYFVRCMAITSFWPPLHNMSEVTHTSKNFFQLSEEERWRLNIIMNTDIT